MSLIAPFLSPRQPVTIRLRRQCLLLVSVLVFCVLHLEAQTVNATLRGTVMDSSGGVITGATVELLEPSTHQVTRTATSSPSGDFDFDELKPGVYELHATSAGFKQFVASNVVLDSGEVRRVDVSMPIGAIAEQVTVSAGAAVINTETATISDTFTMKQYDNSPQVVPYATTYALLTTLAGVQGGFGGYPIANGQQQSQQNQTFDGISNDLAGQQSNNPSFFEQVSASLFNAPAESQSPVQINEVTKRGANAFHGKASYRIYDSLFNATGYFNTDKTSFLQHEWDFQVSGPIWKDRTFFYGGWFGQRIPLGTQYIASVPTDNWRNGIFSATIIDPSTGLPFANNTIPQNRISAVAAAVQTNYLPAANISNGSSVNNYAFHFPFNSDLYRGDWPVVRVDHNLTKSNTFFGRWLMRQTPYVLDNGLPSLIWTRQRRHQQWAAGDTQIISPALVNNFRFGYSIDYIVDGKTESSQTPPDGSKVLTTIGLQGANPSGLTGLGFPEMDIAGLTSLSDVSGGVKDDDHIVNYYDTLDWQRGRHNIRFGGMVQHFQRYRGQVPNYGTFEFDGSITGSPYADFLLGLPQSDSRSNPLGAQEFKLTEYGLFAQDSFALTHKLTLNYGLRWDLYGSPSASDHLMYNFDPSSGNVVVDPRAINKVSSLYPSNIHVVSGSVQATSDKTNFAPRLGVAYEINSHSVVRGGYGLYTARFANTSDDFANFLPLNPQLGSTGPFSLSENYLNQVTPGQAPLLAFPNPFPSTTATASVPSQDVDGYPHQLRHGHIHQYSATYEYQLGQTGFRASYLGSHSTGINYQVNTNVPQPGTTAFTPSSRPYPQFVNTTLLRFDGGESYNAVQFEAKRRVGNLTLSGNYSFAHNLANYLDTENPYDVLSRWANIGATRRHYASADVVWTLPVGHNQRFLGNAGPGLNTAVSGWSTSVITYLASGLWFSPSYSGSDASNTGTFGGLPDKIGDPNAVPGGKSINNWFNDAAFAVPQAGHFGNALPNSLEGQRLFVTDLSLVKSVPITERIHFTFATQISNIFNHPEFLNPSGDISVAGGNQFTSQFGQFDSFETGQQRQITFQGGFTF